MRYVFTVILLLLLVAPAVAIETGPGIDADVSYWLSHVTHGSAEIRYSGVSESAMIQVFASARGWNWLNVSGSGPSWEPIGYDASAGMMAGWKHLYLRVNYYRLDVEKKYDAVWMPTSFWLKDQGVQIALRYENLEIAGTGAGFYVDIQTMENLNVAKTELGVQYVFRSADWSLRFYGSQRTWFLIESILIQGTPYNDTYTVGVEISWKNLSIYAEHYCSHEVLKYFRDPNAKKYSPSCERGGVGTENLFGIRYSYN